VCSLSADSVANAAGRVDLSLRNRLDRAGALAEA
jgi:hypothetical protein